MQEITVLMVTKASFMGIDIYPYLVNDKRVTLYCVSEDMEGHWDLPKTDMRIEGDKRTEVLEKVMGTKLEVNDDNTWSKWVF